MVCFSFNALLLCARPLLLELHMVCLCFLVLSPVTNKASNVLTYADAHAHALVFLPTFAYCL